MEKFFIVFVLLLLFGCVELDSILENTETVDFNGYVFSDKRVPIEGAKVELISNFTFVNFTDSNGYFVFSKIPYGEYLIRISKDGYKEYNYSFTLYPGRYEFNFTIVKDCIYYDLYSKGEYYVIYGFNGTLYRSKLECELPYPQNGVLNISFKEAIQKTRYIGDNRIIDVTIDNLNGKYSSIDFYIVLQLNGTNNIKLYERKNTSIEEAQRMMPNYLGERFMEISGKRVKIIDPNNEEIKAIAENVRKNTNNTWDAALTLFKWLKNNTKYFNEGGVNGEYIQSPAEVMKSRKGDCDELSYLYISLLRAAGIPSRYVEGFLVKPNESRFVRHMWVEFYDGEWVPVEVSGTGKTDDEANVNFGMRIVQHVPIFVDDGTQNSFSRKACVYNYFGNRPQVSNLLYYKLIPYETKYIVVCKDGRSLEEKEEYLN